jgi:diaminohydroxyphosphoribosylaminopyrimidine deaminase / 5-amino-6-(5-phosphoribosylamino)uracil reductase
MGDISPFMRAALDAAMAVRGSTSPNPWVGAVLVRDGRIVATGATSPPPGLHAEAGALVGADARGHTMYVTLEPCAPFDGKRTRPCAEQIIESGVSRVVVGLQDPDPRVSGRGIALLRDAGIDVEVGDGYPAIVKALRPYLKHRETGMPYVIGKFAASLDGRIATNSGDSQWITGEAAREVVHRERAWVDAILTGSGTVLADDPALTARPDGGTTERQPIRIVMDGRGRVPPEARVFHEPGTAIVVTGRDAPHAWKQALTDAGVGVLECEHDQHGLNLHQMLGALGQRGILSVWVEGGAALLGSLFDGEHVDEVWGFVAPLIIGGRGQAAVAGHGIERMDDARRLREVCVERLGDDTLIRGYAGPWEYHGP